MSVKLEDISPDLLAWAIRGARDEVLVLKEERRLLEEENVSLLAEIKKLRGEFNA